MWHSVKQVAPSHVTMQPDTQLIVLIIYVSKYTQSCTLLSMYAVPLTIVLI